MIAVMVDDDQLHALRRSAVNNTADAALEFLTMGFFLFRHPSRARSRLSFVLFNVTDEKLCELLRQWIFLGRLYDIQIENEGFRLELLL